MLVLVLVLLAALVTSAPIFATVLVVVASRHEDARHSLLDRPPGRLDAAARRLVMLTRRTASEATPDGPANDLVGPSLAKPRA
jgi:hypothetical protein